MHRHHDYVALSSKQSSVRAYLNGKLVVESASSNKNVQFGYEHFDIGGGTSDLSDREIAGHFDTAFDQFRYRNVL